MADLVGNIPIEIVQGATKTTRLKFDKVLTRLINEVFFTCEKLNLKYKLEKNEYEEFQFTIDEETSKSLQPTNTTYDISVRINNDVVAIQTGVPFIVKKRQNPLNLGGIDG